MRNYIGLKSGRLTVIGFDHKTATNHVYVKCQCDCGNMVVVRASSILRKITKSCGCYAAERNKEKSIKHGMFGSRIYNIWAGMKRRCLDCKLQSFKWYGAKGIRYCKEWERFEPFFDWAKKNGYNDTLSLDRIDPTGNYCPENCRWATCKQQARNKSNNTVVEYNNEKHCLSEWAEKFNINYSTLLTRLRKGCSIEEALKEYRK